MSDEISMFVVAIHDIHRKETYFIYEDLSGASRKQPV